MARLIDADALFAEFENADWYNNADRDEIAERLVLQAPTIDAVSVMHGEWIRNFDGNEWYWYCSNCKTEWYEEDLWMGGNEFPNFCPNCGADMRKESK